MASNILDREHQAATEPIIGLAAAILLNRQPGLDNLAHREALTFQMLDRTPPIIGAKPEPVLAPTVWAQAAIFQIAPGLSPFTVAQAFFEIGGRGFTGRIEPLAPVILFLALRRRFGQLHPGFVCQLLNRLHEGQTLSLHDEGDDVTANAGREAFEDLLLIIDVEARRLLIGERRQADPFLALLLELYLAPNHFRGANTRLKLIDKTVRDPNWGAHAFPYSASRACERGVNRAFPRPKRRHLFGGQNPGESTNFINPRNPILGHFW